MGNSRERESLAEMMQRTTICVAGPEPGVPAHEGDHGFRETLQQNYSVAENNAVEQLVQLKTALRRASTYDFWSILMEGMTTITGSQYGFVAKRILVDDQDSTVEMPVIGEPGSCLMGVAFYYNDGKEMKDLHRDYKYLAYGAPCHHMKHDKVFLIPNGLPKFITNNPNQFPFPADAYLGIPLFAQGRCFGHFGMMWDRQGREEMRLGWAYIEMLLHSLEDLINDRLLDGRGYASEAVLTDTPQIIPTEAVKAAQSLKPFASSLSHELRTPMQGVVGMLDVMHATIQESLEGQKDAVVRNVLKMLRENIEVVQDSSRRAVEAADNVVHAYDLNMEVPDTPVHPGDEDSIDGMSALSTKVRKPTRLTEGRSVFFRRSKRQRTSDSAESTTAPATKQRHLQPSRPSTKRDALSQSSLLKHAVEESNKIIDGTELNSDLEDDADLDPVETQSMLDDSQKESVPTPGLRRTRIRELLHLIINESLRVGGRPDSAVARETDGGEVIEVKTKGPKGNTCTKMIDWCVNPEIPEFILVDERDLAKLVSCVFLNAIKFTEEGKITLRVTLSSKGRFVVINIVDTGSGIPKAFQPYLFKPFSREDDSLTRQKEGLGLGLLVAKGLARKIGGDLICVKTNVDGPQRGSEFELRVPLSSTDFPSRGSTPIASRYPTSRSPTDPSFHPMALSTTSGGRREHTARSSKRASIQQTQVLEPPMSKRTPSRRPSTKQAPEFDRHLAEKYPLTFLVAEDNTINRRLLVNMLGKLGYKGIHEAHDGVEAVHQMSIDRAARNEPSIDVVLMDIWMPHMDGYEATQRIFAMEKLRREREQELSGSFGEDVTAKKKITVLAVSADVTDAALEKASEIGMEGFMPKPYKILDLERLILEYCVGGGALVQMQN